jgi:aspartate kinase
MTLPGTVVMKFGGESLATPAGRDVAAARVLERRLAGKNVVAVVSAMGRKGAPYATDTLLGLADGLGRASARERDALIACGEEICAALFAALLQERGVQAVSLRGFQAGIITDPAFGAAQVLEVRPQRILAHLNRGEVVVVAGFQGITPQGDVTTIGRGGSDTTAMTLGVALQAERVEIHKEVDGVLSADPRVVPEAHKVEHLTFEEAAELAFKGAKVVHPAAADLARAARLEVAILNSATDRGTCLVPEEGGTRFDGEVHSCATAITSRHGIAQLTVRGGFSQDLPLLERVFGVIAAHDISLDMMSIFPDRVAFTLERARVGQAVQALAELGVVVTVNNAVAKVTLVGGGIHGIPGVMYRVVRALAEAAIPVHQSVDSNMIVGVLVDEAHEERAVRAIHGEFFG